MCQVYSCIVNKLGDVFDDPATHSHEEIIKKHKLNESSREVIGDFTFAKIEIVPPKNNYWNNKYAEWKLIIDEKRKPEWFDEKHEQACFIKLKKWKKEFVFKNKKLKSIENKYGLFLKNCKIESVKNCLIFEMWENSTVNAMGNSTVLFDQDGFCVVVKGRKIKEF